MVPIQAIFDEIKECFNTPEVSVFAASMVPSLRPGETMVQKIQQPAHEVEDPSKGVVEDVATPTVSLLGEEEGIRGIKKIPLSSQSLQWGSV